MISQMGEWKNGVWVWKFRWRRAFFDWELEDLERLQALIEQIVPQDGSKDGVCWHGNNYIKFPIQKILDKVYESNNSLFPPPASNLIWRVKIPPRAKIVLWSAMLEKLKTGDFLVEKGLLDPSNALCPLCNLEVETNSHILFTCSFSWMVWMWILDS